METWFIFFFVRMQFEGPKLRLPTAYCKNLLYSISSHNSSQWLTKSRCQTRNKETKQGILPTESTRMEGAKHDKWFEHTLLEHILHDSLAWAASHCTPSQNNVTYQPPTTSHGATCHRHLTQNCTPQVRPGLPGNCNYKGFGLAECFPGKGKCA